MTNTIANATLASVSETNRSRIMQHLYQHGISSRAQIATSRGARTAAPSGSLSTPQNSTSSP